MERASRILRSQHQANLSLESLCFDKQLNFINDPCLFAMAVTGRRAGKTTACALHLLHTAISHSHSVCLYITLARTNAKKIIWPLLLELVRVNQLNVQINQSELALHFSNGSVIYVSGAATAGEIDRFRGLALTLVYIDESQSLPAYLEQLINDVLVPACFDNKGKIRMIGTPGPVPVGFYYDAYSDPNWSQHHWTMFENPWIETKRGESAQSILEQELTRRGVTENDPTIQREIFGRFVVDTKKLVIDFEMTRNTFDTLLPGTYHHVLGIDVGFLDADAICVLAYSDRSPTTYLIDERVTAKQGLTELVQQLEELRRKYNPHKMMIDEGGLGKKLAEEMRRRHAIPLYGADKVRKFENIEFLNDALRTKRFMVKRGSRFANDALLLEWDFDKSRPDKKVISDRFHSDIVDAVLYAFKESPAYSWQPPVIKPKVGTPQWAKDEEDMMWEQSLEHAKEQEANNGNLEWL